MENNLNATCSVCGIKYHICKDCSNTKTFTPWKIIAHDVNCYKIFLAIRDLSNGYANKEDTKNILKKCDLSELDTYQDNIKEAIYKNMYEEKLKKIAPKVTVDNSDNNKSKL